MTINGPGVVFVKVKVSTDIRAMIITISNLHIKVCLEISFLVFLFKKQNEFSLENSGGTHDE